MNELNLEEILQDKGEHDYIEVPVGDNIFRIFFLAAAALSLVVFFQTFSLGVFNHSFYRERALANMTNVKVTPAPRGVILDRFGLELTKNEAVFNLFVFPDEIEGPFGESEAFAALRRILGAEQADKTALAAEEAREEGRIFVTNVLTQEQVVAFLSEEISGLKVVPGWRRVHNPSFKFSHVIGYTGLVSPETLKKNPTLFISDRVGKTGLEVHYDAYLRGTNGRELFLKDTHGNVEAERILSEVEPGKNLRTFIDKEFQEYFYDRLQNQLRALGRKRGVGIAMNPQNGEVLALFSIPSFDSTDVGSFLTAPDDPLFPRAVGGRYLPGSTIKPLHAVAALSEGIVTPKEQLFSRGYIDVPHPTLAGVASRFRDLAPPGSYDVYSALARSSNVYFYTVCGGYGTKTGLGIAKLHDWWSKFGLGEVTGIDISGERGGFLPAPEWKKEKTGENWRLGDTYNVSIGQGNLLLTPIGLLSYVSGIAADGMFMKPRIADLGPPEIVRSLSEYESAIKEVQIGMRDVISKSYGTAHSLNALPVEVAAKTGTAQISGGKTNSFFVGYAPYDNPELAIIVIVEDSVLELPNTIPVAYDVFLWYYENRLNQ